MKKSKIKHIGVLTSGGDAPGMNAAIRAVVRTSIFNGLRVTGILRGYQGLIDGEFSDLQLSSVANVLQRGGTILKTGRCQAFRKAAGRKKAAENFYKQQLDALVVIGGDGTFRGAHELWKEHRIPVIGVPGTIDNDIAGTDFTIGFDTAVNTALEAIDKIRDTAASHDRLFIVEVMGRTNGNIAAEVGLAGGAEAVVTPENPLSIKQIVSSIQRGIKRGKNSSILVVAENSAEGQGGRSYEIAKALKKSAGFDAKVCILGHIQRGGTPSALDRTIASMLGAGAVEALLKGATDQMAGIIHKKVVMTPFKLTIAKKHEANTELIRLQNILAT